MTKVRIYDLSKELHLENKEILDICDQLNIPVKSHSSTITELQAERIKATAEKYHQQQITGRGGVSPGGSHAPQGERKQEILAIHHRQTRPSSEVSTSVVESPRPPMKPQPPKPSTVTDNTEEPKPSPVATEEGNGSHIQETPETEPLAVVLPLTETEESVAKSTKENEIVNLSESEVPKLLKPPTRPSEKPEKPIQVSEEKTGEKLIAQAPAAPKERPKPLPIPRTAENKQKKGKEAKKPDKRTSVSEGKQETREGKELKPRQKKETKEPREIREHKETREPKAVLELKRPVRPQPFQKPKPEEVEPLIELESEDIEETELIEDESLEKLKHKPKLKRPTPPKISKRQDWEDEDEEREDSKAKAPKTAKVAKNKRRSQVLLEDDEDFETELEELGEIATMVSLSTARPPKPKSMTQTAATSGVKSPPKPAAKPESGRVKVERERRERKEEEKRAEKILFDNTMTVLELSERMRVPVTEIIKNLFSKGIAVNITQTLELDTIQMVAQEFGVKLETAQERAAAAKTTEMLDVEDLENLQPRPPVVTIMGHVDHGKTTLLDSIRKTKVAQGEAGGITQHIGAYHVDVEHDGQKQQIVFLDTPGHEAFTAMRARGARVTDIAVLVVAADDGVQPQTREAISHARAAGVPIVVAINKVDKPDANPDRIKQELAELELVPEEWGGETIMVPVSALKGENLDTLLEMILLVAEMGELSANPDRLAKGTVIEAHLDRTRGPVATLLVQNGTLRVGDMIVAGSVYGKIRAMIDDRGERVEAATPSFAVEILGLNELPSAGDEFDVYENEKEARQIAEQRAEEKRSHRLQQAMSGRRISLSTLSAQVQEGQLKELNLILKADVQGSVEAILGALQQLPQREVQIRVLLATAGEITETDVDLAAASGAVIVGFSTTLASGARAAADREGVDIREYNIIYKLLDDIQAAMEGLLDPEEVEEQLGVAEVRDVFPVGRGSVAGCYVQSGKLVRNRPVRVRRQGQILYEGILDSLKRFKEDAKEVNSGFECGIGISKFNDWQPGDKVEVYEMVFKRRTLSPN